MCVKTELEGKETEGYNCSCLEFQTRKLNGYIKFEKNLTKQNITLISFENFPEFKRYNEFDEKGEWRGRVETFANFNPVKSLYCDTSESGEESKAYYMREMEFIFNNRDEVENSKKGIFRVFNLENKKFKLSHKQIADLVVWFNKNFFQLLEDTFNDMEVNLNNQPFIFMVKVKALTRFLRRQPMFQEINKGEFAKFINKAYSDFFEDFYKDNVCVPGTGCLAE